MPLLLAAIPVDVVVSFALLLILYAFRDVIAKAIGWALTKIPVIGDQLGTYFSAGVDQVVTWAEQWAHFGLDALVQLVSAPVTWIASVVGNIVGLAEGIVSNLATLFGIVVGLAQSISATVVLLLGRIGDVARNLAALVVAVPGIAADVARAVTAAAIEGVRQLIAAVQAGLEAAIQAERNLIAAVRGDVLAFITGQLGVLATAVWTGIDNLEHKLAADVQAIDGQLSQVWSSVTPILGVLPLVVAVPTILELVNIADDCLIPQCRLTGPTLPVLGILADIATVGLVGAAVGEAIANPEAAAAEVAGLVGGIESAAQSLFQLFTGQAAA